MKWDIRERLKRVEAKIDNVCRVLIELCSIISGEDLELRLKECMSMSSVKVKGQSKAAKAKAPMPAVKWSTLTAGLELVIVDGEGNPVPGIDPNSVTTTLVVDDTSKVTVAEGSDSLHYKASKVAGATGDITMTATVSFKSGSPGPFDSTLPITLDVVGASDLQIKISGN